MSFALRWRTLFVGCVLTAATASPAFPQQATPILAEDDVIYCRVDGSALLADLAYPADGEGLPAMLYIHGGRWRSGSKEDIERGLNPRQWAENGFFAMTIDFRLVTSTPAPAAQQDLMCAIRWLHANADEYGVDPDRIYLSGWSSGGHQVALAATLGDAAYEPVGGWEDARSDVRAVMSVSGPYELETLDWGDFWTPLEGDPVEARRLASPIRHVSVNTRPMLIVHSDDDRSVPVPQAIDMVEALEAAGVYHRFVHYADRGHVALTEEVVREMLDFIAEVERLPPDTLSLQVGSPEVDGRVFPVHRARNRVYLGDADTPAREWTNELTLGDSAGVPVMRWVTRGRQRANDGQEVTWELLQTYNARTLAPMAYSNTYSTGAVTKLAIDGTRVRGTRRAPGQPGEVPVDQVLDQPGFFAGASDLVPMAVDLRPGLVMTAPFWSPNMTAAEMRIFSVLGQETVAVEGTDVAAWKVEEREESSGRLIATWWLTEESPYMVLAEMTLPDGQTQRITGVSLDP